MRLFLGDVSGSYAAFKAVVFELGDLKTMFYGLKPSTTDVENIVALFQSRDYYVQIDMANPAITKPSEATLLVDFPNAIQAYINTASF